ncbi:hypothetical protein LRY65_02070 [Candidatus Woesebacteria bacterium]|nr:hypothetical protein [Candidatus Woesebacteria bacterium]MCD8507348.1 hypothetical protein [Candidatus Woesebacteria bacterium]MCD8526979.1 hypothetical protein [Candidatus Woesebacteria bacterium]MCD8546781.1 hypothetical protein [Candidatus Woesebacteria bacterium]
MHQTRVRLILSSGIALGVVSLMSAVLPWSALAQTTDETTSPSAELREIIRQRIEETIQEKESNGPEYIGTLGTVSKVSTNTFTITDSMGLERTIQPTSDSVLLLDGDPTELSDISIGSGAVVMGSPLDEVIIEAKRILIQEDDFTETREVFLGTLTEKGTNAVTISTRGTNEELVIDTNRQTEYEDSVGTSIALSDIEEEQSVLIVTDTDDDDRIATHIRLLVPVESVKTDE